MLLSESSDAVQAYGARPIKRWLQKNVMARISKMIVLEEVVDGCNISVDLGAEKELVFNVKKPSVVVENQCDGSDGGSTNGDGRRRARRARPRKDDCSADGRKSQKTKS
ncbi:hypothetical protein ACP70R_048991 [Stipagrostis hirtigluma subsp. patula]